MMMLPIGNTIATGLVVFPSPWANFLLPIVAAIVAVFVIFSTTVRRRRAGSGLRLAARRELPIGVEGSPRRLFPTEAARVS